MLKPRLILLPALVAGSVIIGAGGLCQPTTRNNGFTAGTPSAGERAISRTTAEIMAADAARGPRKNVFIKREFEIPGRRNRPQDPAARFDPQIAPGAARSASTSS